MNVLTLQNSVNENSVIQVKHTASTSAIPREVIQDKYNKIKLGLLHPRKNSKSVRREITEQRIQENVRQFNSTTTVKNSDDLFVGKSPQIHYEQLQASTHYGGIKFLVKKVGARRDVGGSHQRNYSFEDLRSVLQQ